MKKLIILLFMIPSLYSFSQQGEETEKKAVLEKINLFFESLEKQDSGLFKSIFYSDSQIWRVKKQHDTLMLSMRYFNEDLKRSFNPQEVIHEKPLKVEMKIHENIAIAWVPYELYINEKFSHCGIDVFTLIKADEGWKIVNATYSVEPQGCSDIKKL